MVSDRVACYELRVAVLQRAWRMAHRVQADNSEILKKFDALLSAPCILRFDSSLFVQTCHFPEIKKIRCEL